MVWDAAHASTSEKVRQSQGLHGWEELMADQMQGNAPRHGCVKEICRDCLLHVGPQFLPGISLCDDILTDARRNESPVLILEHIENEPRGRGSMETILPTGCSAFKGRDPPYFGMTLTATYGQLRPGA